MNAKDLFVLTEEEEAYRQMLHSALRERLPHPQTGELMRSLVEIRDATIVEPSLDKEILNGAVSAFNELGAEYNEEKFKRAVQAFRALEHEIKRFLKNPHFDEKKFEEARAIANALGLPGLGISEEFGGDGAKSRQSIIVGEEVSAVDPALALAFGAANTLAMKPIELFGTPEQKAKWLPRMVSGEFTGCYCQTTPDNGSDVAGQKQGAKEVNGEWRITKNCRFITGAFTNEHSGANVALVLARTASDPNSQHYGLTMFLVDMDRARREGTVTFIRNESKAGLHMSPTSEFVFENAVADGVLGSLHDGWKVAMFILGASRGKAITPQAIGTGRTSSELAREYAGQRKVFGRTLDKFPQQRSELLRIDDGVRISRLLGWRAALLLDEMGGLDSRPWQLEASCAKLVSSEMAKWAPSKAMQVMGGTGYMMDAKVAKFWHDGRVIPIYEGTSDVQCIVIMRDLLKRLGLKNLWLLGAQNKFSFATRQATAYHLAESWPVSSQGWKAEEEEFSFSMQCVEWHAPELHDAYHELREQRYVFLTELGKTLRDFPPDPKGDTFPSPYFNLAYVFAVLEGVKLALWEAAFRVHQQNGKPLEIADTAVAIDALRFAAELMASARVSREHLSKFPSLREEIEGKGKLRA